MGRITSTSSSPRKELYEAQHERRRIQHHLVPDVQQLGDSEDPRQLERELQRADLQRPGARVLFLPELPGEGLSPGGDASSPAGFPSLRTAGSTATGTAGDRISAAQK